LKIGNLVFNERTYHLLHKMFIINSLS